MFDFRPLLTTNPTPIPRGANEPSSELQELRSHVERLYFITEALWRILKEKQGLDDVEIEKQIAIIDMEDGKLDGRKATSPPQPCPKCNRMLAKQRNRCMYCGEIVSLNPFAR